MPVLFHQLAVCRPLAVIQQKYQETDKHRQHYADNQYIHLVPQRLLLKLFLKDLLLMFHFLQREHCPVEFVLFPYCDTVLPVRISPVIIQRPSAVTCPPAAVSHPAQQLQTELHTAGLFRNIQPPPVFLRCPAILPFPHQKITVLQKYLGHRPIVRIAGIAHRLLI